MYWQVRVEFMKFFDGSILASDHAEAEQARYHFYEMQLSQCGECILRKAFTRETAGTLFTVLGHNSDIQEADVVMNSARQVVGRLRDDENDVYMHVYAVLKLEGHGRVGYQHRISENSNSQDASVACVISFGREQGLMHKAIKVSKFPSRKITFPESIEFSQKRFWPTERNFYGSCHYDTSSLLRSANLSKIYAFLIDLKRTDYCGTSSLVLCQKFVKVVMRGINYNSDVDMSNPTEGVERGDASVECTGSGDCEDYAHYLMRMLRTLFDCWDKFPGLVMPGTCLYDSMMELASGYVPLVYICSIKMHNRAPMAHSTLILLRKNKSLESISLEVTNPSVSMTMANKKSFDELHIMSYILLDALVHVNLTEHGLGGRIGDLTFAEDFVKFAKPY